MSNEGEVRYEASSERLGQEAVGLIFNRLDYYRKGSLQLEETERMTLLAGCLMLIQWRVRVFRSLIWYWLTSRSVEATYGDLRPWWVISSTSQMRFTPLVVQEPRLIRCRSACKLGNYKSWRELTVSFENLLYHEVLVHRLDISSTISS